MYKQLLIWAAAALALPAAQAQTQQQPSPEGPVEKVAIGELAPGFTLRNTQRDEQMTLSQFRGKTVVLEWVDYECPAVQQLYRSGAMQALQDKYTDDDTVDLAWLTIVSSPPGVKTHMSADVARRYAQEYDADPSQVLMDPNYAVGRTWNIDRVPKVFVINDSGDVVYKGGVGPADVDSPEEATRWLDRALQETLNSKPVSRPVTPVSGCVVEAGRGGGEQDAGPGGRD